MFIPLTDEGFVEWVDANPDGYVINSDKARKKGEYPKLHRAGCATYQEANRYLNSGLKEYVTGRWDKCCSLDKAELEKEGKADPRGLKPCGVCKP